jgi:hypothetical protein
VFHVRTALGEQYFRDLISALFSAPFLSIELLGIARFIITTHFALCFASFSA